MQVKSRSTTLASHACMHLRLIFAYTTYLHSAFGRHIVTQNFSGQVYAADDAIIIWSLILSSHTIFHSIPLVSHNNHRWLCIQLKWDPNYIYNHERTKLVAEHYLLCILHTFMCAVWIAPATTQPYNPYLHNNTYQISKHLVPGGTRKSILTFLRWASNRHISR